MSGETIGAALRADHEATVDEIGVGIAAIGRVAHALVDVGSLQDVTTSALTELRAVLGLEQASLYLPDSSGRPLLVRRTTVSGADVARVPVDEVSFEPEAWKLAITSGAPMVFREQARWLIENPFEPTANSWLVLPLMVDARLLGAVIASADQPISVQTTAVTVLRLLGDLMAAGINRAELRQELERASLDAERTRLAALVHDGLAQDLALAMREIAWLESEPTPDVASASWTRLRRAVQSANTLVRERLKSLSLTIPLGGIHDATAEICERYVQRGLTVRLEQRGPDVNLPAARSAAVIRVLKETLMNVLKHAEAGGADVLIDTNDGVILMQVTDHGSGFVVNDASGQSEGHLGLTLMRQRAAEAAGTVEWSASPGGGTRVTLRAPVTQ
jgi:signal transduction histidine kinase